VALAFGIYAKIDNIHHQKQKETSNKEYLTFG
jgi:hypothetical protein